MPDRDEFINVTRSTRAAAGAVSAWLDRPSDEAPRLAERVLSDAINATGGVPAYMRDLSGLLRELAASPLLYDSYQAADAVDEFFASRGTNLFDKILQKSVVSSVMSGTYEPGTVIPNALVQVVDALIVDARGGLVSSRDAKTVEARREDLHRCFLSAAENVGRKLQNNKPGTTIRTPALQPLDVHENLLGGERA